MAKDKKSFIAYGDWLETFDELSDEEAGKLVKHLFRYVNDMNPEAPDRLTKMMFISIKRALKADLVKYEQIKAKRVEAGRKGGKQTQAKQANAYSAQANQAVNVNGNVTVNDTVNVNTKEIRELNFREQVAQHTTYESSMRDSFCDYWTESNEKGKKLKFEMQKTFDVGRRLKKWSSNNFGGQDKKEVTDFKDVEYP